MRRMKNYSIAANQTGPVARVCASSPGGASIAPECQFIPGREKSEGASVAVQGNSLLRTSQLFFAFIAIIALVTSGCGGGSTPIANGFQNPASGSGGGTITQPPPGVTITITPSSVSVQPGGSVKFSGAVQNATNNGIDWFVDGVAGGNQTIGTISSSGSYQAPATAPTPNSVMVTAVSQQDPTKQAQAIVVISTSTSSITVSASPSTITLQTGASTVFSATVTGTANTAVTWRVNGIPGGNATIGTMTASGVYTAPVAVPANPVITITAASVADPAVTGIALVTIVQRVAVQVSPTAIQVQAFLTQQFNASVTGTTNTAVTWAVNGVAGGSASIGTISPTGLYTAPGTLPNPNAVTISATSVADTSVVSYATVTIVQSIGVTVSVSPVTSSLDINQPAIFVATVGGLFRGTLPSSQVNWNANNLPGGSATAGFIVPVPCPGPVPANSSCGQYTAPSAVPLPNTVTITAYSVSDPTAFISVSVLITAPVSVSVSVAPANVGLQVSTAQQFTATVSGSANQGVTWSVNGVAGGNATVGTIINGGPTAGLYTAPAVVPAGGAVLISAASVVNPTSTGSASVTIQPAPPTITVAVAPANAVLQVNNTQLFAATVTGTANQSVTWNVNGITGGNATVGTISAAGLYTAPATVPAGGSVLISAVSVASPASVGSASVTVNAAPPVVSVTVSPANPAVQVNNTQQFTATVAGTANQSVTWSVNGVNGGNATFGTISAAGLYTAPAAVPAGGAVLVAATSVASPTSAGSAGVTILAAPPPVTISVSPSLITLRVNDQFQFTATVTGTANMAVTWQVNGVTGGSAANGFISAAGLYTAPAAPPASAVTVTAISAVAPNPSASATVTVQPLATISMNPATATVNVNLGVQFFVNITGLSNTAVTFSVNGIPGGNSSVGTVSAAGLYVAPAAAPAAPVAVRATAVADPTLIATSTVTVVVPVTVSVTPGSASIAVAGTQQFNATVTGSANQAVTWSVNAIAGGNATVGTISAAGLYTAPNNLVLTQAYSISARSVADPTASGTASVTVNVPVSVSVSPTTANVRVGATQQFSSTVMGSANTNVNWTVSAGGGSITAGGLYTAPAAVPAGAVTVTATSVADPTKSATATVTVQPGVSVTVSPATANVIVSQTQQFTATVTGTPTTAVTWSVAGGGTIGASSGLYTAPAAPAGPVTITATSTDGSNTTGTATVTVIAAISVTVTPAAAALNTNQSQQFSATVTGTANQAVTWSVTGGGSINSTTGLYTAPAVAAAAVTVTATSQQDPTKSGTATLTVSVPPSGVFVTVFPQGKNLPVGKAQQFTANVIRANNQSVAWSVNGIVGGNSTVGTIDAAGVYSPPSVRPANPAITVTACSNQVPAACMTVNGRIVPDVTVSPASARVEVSGGTPTTLQLSAVVIGVSNTAVTWEVNGTPGGNSTFGTISGSGLYTAPANTPSGFVSIAARSAADSTVVGSATLNVFTPSITARSFTGNVLPGGKTVIEHQLLKYPQTVSANPVVNWFVNGIAGGNATVGTVSPEGRYSAPATPQSVTVEARSTVDPTLRSSATVNVVSPVSPSMISVLPSTLKFRPYDYVSGGNTNLIVNSLRNQYVSWQLLVETRLEDLTGMNLTISNLVDSSGNVIPASNVTIYLEKNVNVAYPSRVQDEVGEYPDPLIPKVDPFLGQTRNAFPFNLNRISPAYRIYPRSGGDTVNTGIGVGRAVSGGVFTGSVYRHFVAQIDRAGTIGTATFKWSNDGGATFAQANVPVTASAITLSDGVTITFQSAGQPGNTDFAINDTFWIFAAPSRIQMLWFDAFVPAGVPAGTYVGNMQVTKQGAPFGSANITIQVTGATLATSSKIPSYFGMNWTHLQNAHFGNSNGPQIQSLGQLYGVACLINRINCDTASVFTPSFTFNSDGTIATSNYTAYDQATAPLANGSITPHGEQLTVLRLPRAGATVSEQYFATENLLAAMTTRGWRSRVFDLSFDEPTTPTDAVAAMARASLVRSVDSMLRTAVTADITAFNSNLVGYANRWVPNVFNLDRREHTDGPNSASRAFYNAAVAAGDEIWWYNSCRTHSCTGPGASPRFDNFISTVIDSSSVLNRLGGVMAASPFKVTGVLYQDTVTAYARSFAMSGPPIDVWESTYYNGGNGEGTLFYPGRPSMIGGTSDIPIESLRLKQIRDAMIDMEYALEVSVIDPTIVADDVRAALDINSFSANVNPSSLNNLRNSLLQQVGAPPPAGGVTVPSAGGSYLDPVTGNRVHVVTDNNICRGGSLHFYSYWPIWNQTGTHLIIECENWTGNSQQSTALLVRNSDLAILGDVTQGAPSGMNPFQLFWSWTNPNVFYGFRNLDLVSWDPFSRTGGVLFNFGGTSIAGATASRMRLAYVSFDDRYFLMELLDASFNGIGLAVWDRVSGTVIGTLDTRPFAFYDEAIFSKDNMIWFIGNPPANTGLESRRYPRDFSSFVRPADHGHHAHGILRNGTPAAIKAGSNRDCLGPGASGNPPGQGWRPTALLLDERVNSPNVSSSFNPLPAEVFRVGCQIAGQHDFEHFSWNNTQDDFFFTSTGAYSPPGTDSLADSIVQVRLTYNGSNQVVGDNPIVLIPHRSEPARFGYYALPRASCNQQGTRCIFSSSMTVNTNKTSPTLHLYIVDVP